MVLDVEPAVARRPAILAVDDEPADLAAVARDLRRGWRALPRPAGRIGEEALDTWEAARRVRMLVRGPALEASMPHYLIEQLADLPKVEVRTGTSAPPRTSAMAPASGSPPPARSSSTATTAR